VRTVRLAACSPDDVGVRNDHRGLLQVTWYGLRLLLGAVEVVGALESAETADSRTGGSTQAVTAVLDV